MVRPRGDGIKIIRYKKSDGSMAEYRYLRPDRAPAMLAAPPATIEGLCVAYLASAKFRQLAGGTQAQYRRIIEMIRSDWGVHPVLAIKPSHVQQLKDTWQDRFWCKLSASLTRARI
jgi:hypothetical protein